MNKRVRNPALTDLGDRPSHATLSDVARRAGVSTATVSRYLNRTSFVAPETAERIGKAVEALNYVPNVVAGSLASSRSRLVAILLPHLAHSIVDETVEAMVGELSGDGMVVMLGLTGTDEARTNEMLMAALARRVDAIITTGIVTEPARTVLRRSKTTVIEVWGLPEDPVDVAVGFSHLAVGRELAVYVRRRGYVRPHLITARGIRAERRRTGFLEAWSVDGAAPPTEDQVDIPSGFAEARGVLAAMRRLDALPDVVVCGSDFLARGLIVEAQASGLSVPGDFAVIGFGNSSIAGDMRPTITSVDIDGVAIGREAIAILRARAAGEAISKTRIDVGFRIIARDTA